MTSHARLFSCVLGLIIVALFGVALIGSYQGRSGRVADTGPLLIEAGTFSALEGWQDDDPVAAFAAFLRSCDRLSMVPPERFVGRSIRSENLQKLYGRASDWQEVCAVADMIEGDSAVAVRTYFESLFIPVRIYREGDQEGLFTGYYEPLLRGSRVPTARYSVPLLKHPDDLVSVDLGQFRDELKGERLAGKVVQNRLVPYASRAVIDANAQEAPAGVLVWVDDVVDAFFLQIQGGGRVVFEDGEVMRVGYAASNGHPYTAIGKVLLDQGALSREKMSMQAIRSWLEAHPEDAREIMNANASYVFFQAFDLSDPALGPPGAQNVSLTPGRSLAVDRRYHALGVPVWVEGLKPAPHAAAGMPSAVPFRQMMVMQDTGGAIRGVGRADVFWGFGVEAAAVAGPMKHQGRFTVLIPKRLARLLTASKITP